MTNITFTEDELHLLDKGLKYNLHRKPKTWVETLALEADTAIRTLPEENQAYMRQLVANDIQKLISKENLKRNKTKHTEWRTIKNIKQLINNQSIITKGDKGNTLIIIKNDDCINELQNFIN
jgi:hypothetical protein